MNGFYDVRAMPLKSDSRYDSDSSQSVISLEWAHIMFRIPGLSLDLMTQPYQGLRPPKPPRPAPPHLISIFIDVCRWLLSCRRRGAKRPPRTADSWWELGWMACQVHPWRPLLAWDVGYMGWGASDWLAGSIFSQTILIDCSGSGEECNFICELGLSSLDYVMREAGRDGCSSATVSIMGPLNLST